MKWNHSMLYNFLSVCTTHPLISIYR